MIHTPLNNIENVKDAVFLAGPCPRSNQDWEDWRTKMINELEKQGFGGDIISPTNPNYDTNDNNYYNKQCTWETIGLNTASCIVFWIDRNDEHPALTTNIEFGIWSDRCPKGIVVGVPPKSEHCGYIKWVCEKKGIPVYETMQEVVQEVVSRFNRPMERFFTSDTHFGSDRHLELSKRPFANTFEMDMRFISNWNKTVNSNDVVYHLGDFGDFKTLKKLNFGVMFLLMGNYERDIKDIKIDDPRVIVTNKLNVNIDDEYILCVHEPLCDNNSNFFLYGHIHEKGLVKRNGLNVGIDAHNYTPIDINTIKFYKNAILNHYDENVFTDWVGIK